MAVEDTQEFKAWDEASAQWQAIFDKVKQDCPDKNHVLHRQAKDEFEKAKAHFTGCQQASENVPATEQHASAYPALLPIGEAQPCGGRVMGIESLSDESVLRFYEVPATGCCGSGRGESLSLHGRGRQATGRAFADRDRPAAPAL